MQKFLLGLFGFLLLEILILIQVGYVIGGLNTILVMLAMMIVGVVIIKTRFKQAMGQLQQGQVDISVIFLPLAGFLFMFPGFLSDIIAILLIIPPFQNRCIKMYKNNSGTGTSFAFRTGSTGGFTDVFTKSSNTIDGSATVVEESSEETVETVIPQNVSKKEENNIVDADIIEDDADKKN